jgi:Pectate lyase superfamily protein
MPKSIPTSGSLNWAIPLNEHMAQLQDPTNGAINSFSQFSQRPSNLTANDIGKTYIYTQTGNLHQWTGTEWKVLNESVINVKDYGAVGDGIANDSAAVQTAVNFNKAVYFPTGKYLVTTQIELNVDNSATQRSAPKIIGDGTNATVFINNVANGSLFNYKQFSNQYFTFGYGLEMKDFIITTTTTPANSNGISISGAANPIFTNIRMKSLSGHGFVFPFDTDGPLEGTAPNQYINADAFTNFFSIFTSCAVEGCGKWGWMIDTGNSPVTMTSCYASGCGGGGMYNASIGNVIISCSFSYCGTLGNPKSGGLQLGDDYSTKPAPLNNSYPTQSNNYLKSIELDSNYNFNLIATGYLNTFENIRLLQGSLPLAPGQTTFDAPVFVRCGMPGSPLFSSTFENIIIRTVSHTSPSNPAGLTGTVFGEYNGSYSYNIRFKNVFNIFDQPGSSTYNGLTNLGLAYYKFANSNSYNILAEDTYGNIVYKKQANGYATSIPVTGNNIVGKIVYNENPTLGGYTGWVCIVSGTPGTWNGFGLIQ